MIYTLPNRGECCHSRFGVFRKKPTPERGPSLPARLVARRSAVLRPDPPPWCLPLPFLLTVIGGASSPSLLCWAPRVSPVDPGPFASCRRCYPAGEGCRCRLLSVSSCCLRARSTVSATGLACAEATSTFTARYDLMRCCTPKVYQVGGLHRLAFAPRRLPSYEA
jgi:hypothetical protein